MYGPMLRHCSLLISCCAGEAESAALPASGEAAKARASAAAIKRSIRGRFGLERATLSRRSVLRRARNG